MTQLAQTILGRIGNLLISKGDLVPTPRLERGTPRSTISGLFNLANAGLRESRINRANAAFRRAWDDYHNSQRRTSASLPRVAAQLAGQVRPSSCPASFSHSPVSRCPACFASQRRTGFTHEALHTQTAPDGLRINMRTEKMNNEAGREMTKGEKRVGKTFNPSGDNTVTVIKAIAAELIDVIEAIPSDRDTPLGNEKGRLKAIAQTEIESAAMWAVKAATKTHA